MKRLTTTIWLCVALLVPVTARAQLTMQMSNGWSFSFAGNINVFWVYTKEDSNGTAGSQAANSSIRTGLLPAFATFDAKGKEAGLNLGVHFGFAPQVNNGGVHDNFGNGTQAGAQIDMRQVYVTIGGHWGQFLVGRELGLFGRQNILNDQTLYGVGAVGIGGGQAAGTTLGRIGYGYIYPNFNAQVTYSSKSGRPLSLSLGLFQPSVVLSSVGPNSFNFTPFPRLEAEVTYNTKSGNNKFLVWGGGLVQNASAAATDAQSLTSVGGTAGVRADISALSIVLSGYAGKGLGTLLMFSGVAGGGISSNDSTARPSDGGYLQVGYNLSKKTTVAVSAGLSRLKNAGEGEAGGANGGPNTLRSQLTSYTAGFYHQWTKSLRFTVEVTQEHQQGIATPDASQLDLSGGILLFY
jgi:hypothetical protein